MKKLSLLVVAFPIMLFTSCGGDKKEENIDVEKNPLGALMKMGENMKENAEKMEKKAKDHKNAKAIHYEELIKFLPESVSGYEIAKEPRVLLWIWGRCLILRLKLDLKMIKEIELRLFC